MTNTMPEIDAVTAAQNKPQPILHIAGLSKKYRTKSGERQVLDSIDLGVERGQFACIVGPSGTGKTTLLRCIAGLLQPTAGTVTIDGDVVTSPPAQLAVVFQDYSRSLMPWMSVDGNVQLPLRSRKLSKAERIERAQTALRAVGLRDAGRHYPFQLSGGMQQRVAIARALAARPDVLLMDEPFASVDAQTRAELEDLVLGLRTEFGVTVLLVTHDIDEAVYLGDKVVVLTGAPSRIRASVDVDLGSGRDQLTTKARPEFTALRTQILHMIRDRAAQ
jgi:NitT/TauT family transport system ATP-binding protein